MEGGGLKLAGVYEARLPSHVMKEWTPACRHRNLLVWWNGWTDLEVSGVGLHLLLLLLLPIRLAAEHQLPEKRRGWTSAVETPE